MKKSLFAGAMALALSACVSDQRLAEIRANHRADVCAHQEATRAAAALVVFAAEKSGDVTAIAIARAAQAAELAIIASCPPPS